MLLPNHHPNPAVP